MLEPGPSGGVRERLLWDSRLRSSRGEWSHSGSGYIEVDEHRGPVDAFGGRSAFEFFGILWQIVAVDGQLEYFMHRLGHLPLSKQKLHGSLNSSMRDSCLGGMSGTRLFFAERIQDRSRFQRHAKGPAFIVIFSRGRPIAIPVGIVCRRAVAGKLRC